MADGIDEAFGAFEQSLRPTAGERDALLALRERAATALATESKVLRLVDTGAHAHGTAVRSVSRFDVFVVLRGKPKSFARAVETVRGAVPSSVMGETIGQLGTSPDADVLVEQHGSPGLRLIPAFEAPEEAGDVLWVPDAAHRWVRHRPAARPVLLSRIDDDGMLRRLIRLLIAWKHGQGIAASSYYLETAAILQALQQRSFSTLWDLCWLWERFAVDSLVNLPDITSPSQTQMVRACGSLARVIEAQFPIDRAASSARRAVNASMDGDLETCAAALRALFGDAFPELTAPPASAL